jgi:hypothetical protein
MKSNWYRVHYGDPELRDVSGMYFGNLSQSPYEYDKVKAKEQFKKSIENLDEFIKSRVQAEPAFSFKVETLQIHLLVALRRLEAAGELFLKEDPKGTLRVYKQFKCYGSVAQWKNCPELHCTVTYVDPQCHHFPGIKTPWCQLPDMVVIENRHKNGQPKEKNTSEKHQ